MKICSSVHCVAEHSLTCSPACASASCAKRRESADASVGTVKVTLGNNVLAVVYHLYSHIGA